MILAVLYISLGCQLLNLAHFRDTVSFNQILNIYIYRYMTLHMCGSTVPLSCHTKRLSAEKRINQIYQEQEGKLIMK